MKHPIPAEILSQHVAVLGKTGSGKTSTAKLLVEQVVADGARVCVLDPIKSDWWGLTSSADGKRAGLPFHILGGPRGHVPLHASAGKAIAEIVANGSLPLSILDMADFEPGGQAKFFVDFAPTLLRRMRGVVYLVIEEAHLFAPKERSGIGAENMAIHWSKTLATAGRSKGIRLIVLSQRVQALHNAVLGSCDTLIAHRLTAPADQKPIVYWLKANASPEVTREVSGSLASLKTGQGWICSGEARVFEARSFPRIHTYDNTATPTGDGDTREVKTAPVDQEKLRAIIGHAVDEAKANDPTELKRALEQARRDVAVRDKEISKLQAAKSGTSSFSHFSEGQKPPKVIEKRLEGIVKRLEALAERVAPSIELARNAGQTAQQLLLDVQKTAGDVRALLAPIPAPATSPALVPPQRAAAVAPRREITPRAAATASADGVTPAKQRILDGLAFLESIGIPDAERTQVALLADQSPTSGNFTNYLGNLRSAGLIEYPTTGRVRLTDAGREVADAGSAPSSTDDLHRILSRKIPPAKWRIVEALIASYPAAMSRDDLARAAGQSPTSGNYTNYLGNLRSLGLIDYPQTGMVQAQAVLFLEGR